MPIARRHYRVTLADAITAHDTALTFGGRDGIASLHLIESAIARPYSGYHRSMERKCAAILHGVVANHGFVDGNKRTALLLAALRTDRSGYAIVNGDFLMDDLVVAVADNQMSFDALTDWFHEHLVRK